MPKSSQELDQLLDQLESGLAQMIQDYPEVDDFWQAFAGEAEAITDGACEATYAAVHHRIETMLAAHGLNPD